MLKNEKILNQISQENKKLKSQNVSSNKIIDSLEIEEDNKERNILKEKKNKIFLPKIQEQNKKMITNKSKELGKVYTTLKPNIKPKNKAIKNFSHPSTSDKKIIKIPILNEIDKNEFLKNIKYEENLNKKNKISHKKIKKNF